MRNKKTKMLGIVLLFIAFLIASINSILVTNPNILDTDASTYIVVVMLMLFLFIFFCAKEDLTFEFRKKSVILGVAIFLIYIVILSYLRAGLSFSFLSYRIDTALFPLLMLSLITVIFGVYSLKKLYPIVIYSAFASPLFLMPLLNLNSAFANLNALVVYGFVKALGLSVSKAGLVITSGISSITISTTCVSLGTFVAFVMFLIPIAYLYNGKLKSKFYWIFSGIVLILFLNLLRMLLITFVWVYYGINGAISIFHVFAGQFIFYAAIIVMVLLIGKFELKIGKVKKGGTSDVKNFYKAIPPSLLIATSIVIVFALLAFFFNSGYTNSIYSSALLFKSNQQFNNVTLYKDVLVSVENARDNILILQNNPNGELLSLSEKNSSVNSSIFLITNYSYSLSGIYNSISFGSKTGQHSYLLRNGITVSAQTVYSGNSIFDVNYFSRPYNASGTWINVNYLLFKRINSTEVPDCTLAEYSYANMREYIQSDIYNLINGENYSDKGLMCQSYLIASSN